MIIYSEFHKMLLIFLTTIEFIFFIPFSAYCNNVETPPSSIQPQRIRLQEVQLQEKRSLDALKVFVDHACQVLGFWKIMCEHQFHVITSALNQVKIFCKSQVKVKEHIRLVVFCSVR